MLSTDKMKRNSAVTYNVCHLKNQHLSVLPHSFNRGPTQFPRMQHLDWKQLLLYLPLCGICWQILILEWQHHYSVFIQVYQDKQPLIHVDKESLKMFCCSFQHAVAKSLLALIQDQSEIQSTFSRDHQYCHISNCQWYFYFLPFWQHFFFPASSSVERLVT